MKFQFSQNIFEKCSNIEFYENPSSGNHVLLCGQAEGQTGKLTNMTKLLVAFRNFINLPKIDRLVKIISF